MDTTLVDGRARKISETMRARKLDNFKQWRDTQKREGAIKSVYPSLKEDGDLAELIGVVLGDGHLYKHDRCESLRITGTASNTGFSSRYTNLVQQVFLKSPSVRVLKRVNAVTITIYEKHISARIGLPCGNRARLEFELPLWIRNSAHHRIRFLRGLYEAEGSLSHHAPTSTHKLCFSNRNISLLRLVFELVSDLGFKAHMSNSRVQVSRKVEVQNLANLLEFRHYIS